MDIFTDNISNYINKNNDDMIFIQNILDRANLSSDEYNRLLSIVNHFTQAIAKDTIETVLTNNLAKITSANVGRLDYDVKGETYGRNPLS